LITEQEIRIMKRRLTILALTTLAVVALISVVLTAPSPAHAGGATQIAGVGFFADPDAGECTNDAEGNGSDFALRMEGDLEGCHYVFVETAECSPSGTYRETGTETFVGEYNGRAGTFETSYRFTAKLGDCPDLATEIWGRCQHPIIPGTGTGDFAGVTGRFNIEDDVVLVNFPYKGHLRFPE
jgi:hypothetical protein